MSKLAILAGAGQLPVSLAEAFPDALCIAFEGMGTKVSADRVFRFEHLGSLFEYLKDQKVERVVMAGAMSRPALDPKSFDEGMKEIAPSLIAAMAGGDDGLLRQIISIFEGKGLRVVGSHTLLPELTADEGMLVGSQISEEHEHDIRRADSILGTLSPVDVGQAVVVEGGVCLGVETIQGTDALLSFVEKTDSHLRQGVGILVKRPKVGQDLRVDMPAIGPATVANAKSAGLAGIVISPGSVLLVDRENLIKTAEDLGMFIAARRHS